MKKSTLIGLGFILAGIGASTLTSVDVAAHGYVSEPASRGYQGSLDKNTNWNLCIQKIRSCYQ